MSRILYILCGVVFFSYLFKICDWYKCILFAKKKVFTKSGSSLYCGLKLLKKYINLKEEEREKKSILCFSRKKAKEIKTQKKNIDIDFSLVDYTETTS